MATSFRLWSTGKSREAIAKRIHKEFSDALILGVGLQGRRTDVAQPMPWQRMTPLANIMDGQGRNDNFWRSFKYQVWFPLQRNSGLGPDWLPFWSTACPTYLFSTKIQVMSQPNCQYKWSASLPVIIISFLLCLIVALLHLTSVGLPDSGMPVFSREDNTEKT